MSHNTIKKYLNDATPPRYQRSHPPVRHMLQGFEDRLRILFEQDQKRARGERLTAVKLYELLVEEGYTGSYSLVCRFVRWLAGDACITEKQSAEGMWIRTAACLYILVF